ncbi:MAG: AAA family ATPase [Lentihominibacter sp.]
MEKALPAVFNILLQLLDDGRLTDNQGRTVDFKNTIVIMTSNIGSNYLIDGIRADGTVDEEIKEKVENETKKYFRPEFLNRVDEIVVFSPLTESQIVKIIELAMKDIEKRLEERGIKLTLTDKAKKFIADESYDPSYGARPVKRFLQRNVETELAGEIIRGTVKDGDDVIIDCNGEKLTFAAR